MTTKIVDISDEIYRELGEPADLSLASIAFWLRTNIGDLNILINKKYYINEDSLEIAIPTAEEGLSADIFSNIEKSIFKMTYMIHYYERLFRNALGAASTDSTIEIDQNGFRARKVNKNELAKTYSDLRKQIVVELNNLVKNYNINESKPIQVAGDDSIAGGFTPYTYGVHIRNLENL